MLPISGVMLPAEGSSHQAHGSTNFAHSTQKHGDDETNNTTAHPRHGTVETNDTSAPEKCTKNAHFSPAKATTVSIPNRYQRAKAMAVSNHRATSPAAPTRSARGRRRDPISTHSHAIPPTHTSRLDTQSLKFQAIHRATNHRRQGIACETKDRAHFEAEGLAGQRANAPSNISHEGPTGMEGAGGASLRCPWAAWPGQATHRHPDRLEAAARPAGPGRASSRRAERSSRRGRLAGGPPPTGASSSTAENTKQREAARPHRDQAAHTSCDSC